MRIFACKIKAYLFIPHDWGIEHERILWMIKRVRRAVPRSASGERMSEPMQGTANGKEGVEALKMLFYIAKRV